MPKSVYAEISVVYLLKTKVDKMVSKREMEIVGIDYKTVEYKLYSDLYNGKIHNRPRKGRGKAASIALTKINNGILASNNLKDVAYYIRKYKLLFLTTGEILFLLFQHDVILLSEGNIIWSSIISKKRVLSLILSLNI